MRAVASALLFALIVCGCAEQGISEATTPARTEVAVAKSVADYTPAAPSQGPAALRMNGMMGGMGGRMMGESAALAEGMEGVQVGQGVQADPVPDIPRKIIYTADIGMVVEDFPRAEASINELVRKFRGYIADMTLTGSPGVNRSARWKIRVPVDAFEAFLSEAGSIGELERQNRGSADVSEEFYDLEARIRNKKVEEARLIKILEENTGKIEEVLRIEAELSRVRGEVERMEGRIRVLENMTSLTTVNIDIRERVKFEPPPPVAASFPTRMDRAFRDSWDRLVRFGENVAIAIAESWTFLLFVALPGLIIGLILLRVLSRRLPRWLRQTWTALNTRLTPPPAPPAA